MGGCPSQKIIVLVGMRDTAWGLWKERDCQAGIAEPKEAPSAQRILLSGPDQIGEKHPSPPWWGEPPSPAYRESPQAPHNR